MTPVGREWTRLGTARDRCGGALLASDGRTCQAVTGQQRHVSGRTLGPVRAESDATIAASLTPLDRHDVEDTPLQTPTAAQRPPQLEPWQARQPRDQRSQPPRQPSGAQPMSLPDPDRRQSTRGDSRLGGDQVHGAVDAQDNLRVAHAGTQAVTDPPQRVPMAERAQQTVGAETLEVVADRGDSDGAEVQQCAAEGWTVDLPTPPTSAHPTLGRLGQACVTYNPAQEVSVCPAGATLTARLGPAEQGRTLRD
jgi:hypothetical protein